MIKPMRKFLLVSFQLITLHFLSGQIPNAGFELWDNQPVPLLWETNSRPITDPAWEPYIVRQDTERYSGNYAANFWANGFFKAYATTTFPVAIHPVDLSLYYKLSFAPCVNDPGFPEKDTVSVLVEILNNGTVVDQGYWERTSTSFNYSQLVIPISQNAAVFDSCRITIWGGKVFGGCGIIAAATEFKVDELELSYPAACANTGVVVQGVSCLLIDTGGAPLLLPCNTTLPSLGFSAGDTIYFSFVPNPGCISFCLQGSGIDITCLDTSNRINCNISVSLQKQNPTSYVATNGRLDALATGGNPPLLFVWSNGVNGYGVDSIIDLGEGNYCVTVSDVNNCTASACDSLAGPHICIDSALMCIPPHLCCDAPLVDPVCGCDGITYTNGCIATFLNGVTSYTQGPCVTTGVNNTAATSGVRISPNPARDRINVMYEVTASGKTEIRITNLLGQEVKYFSRPFEVSGKHSTDISVSDLAKGVYLVEIKTETDRKLKKFAVE